MIAILPVICVVLAIAAAFVYRMRRSNMAAHQRFVAATLPHLDSTHDLEHCSVRPDFQDLRPGRAVGLLRFLADLRRGGRFRWVNRTDTTMLLGCMKMHTLLFIPDYSFNLPMLSVDIIFAGKRRVFIIEIIDTAGIADPYLQQHYAAMLALKPPADKLPEMPVTYWYKDLLPACSIHARLAAADDDFMCATYTAYLNAYAAMVRDARPVPEATAALLRDKQRWYAQSLLDHGGPAVDVLAKLLGRERGRQYVLSTMFGYDA